MCRTATVAARRSVKFIREGRGERPLKGSRHTDELTCEVTYSTTERRISRLSLLVLPIDEELMIARHTVTLIGSVNSS